MFDPADAAEVTAALEAMVHVIDPHAGLASPPTPISSATSTWVWRTEFSGAGLPKSWDEPTVVRIFRAHEVTTAIREDGLSEYLLRHGYPAAETLWRGELAESNPALVQRRLPGRPAIEILASSRLRTVVRDLAVLQARLHAVPSAGCPLGTVSTAGYLETDLARRRARLHMSGDDEVWAWLQLTAAQFDTDERVVCHGDFHPLNALVDDDGSIGIVDWTDAVLADRHLDVGRSIAIYWFASLVAESRAERVALRAARGWLGRSHRRVYESTARVELDDQRLAWWQVVHLYRGWLQLEELHAPAVEGPQSTTTQRFPADLRDRLLTRCGRLRHAAGD
ncbi:MAG: aminoglycoside phosphotransferase family protein [Actinomycetota bacterium]|nr:MAG: aminoglycoside phosphotransferase [Acidimicrobiaceae bacterium]